MEVNRTFPYGPLLVICHFRTAFKNETVFVYQLQLLLEKLVWKLLLCNWKKQLPRREHCTTASYNKLSTQWKFDGLFVIVQVNLIIKFHSKLLKNIFLSDCLKWGNYCWKYISEIKPTMGKKTLSQPNTCIHVCHWSEVKEWVLPAKLMPSSFEIRGTVRKQMWCFYRYCRINVFIDYF